MQRRKEGLRQAWKRYVQIAFMSDVVGKLQILIFLFDNMLTAGIVQHVTISINCMCV